MPGLLGNRLNSSKKSEESSANKQYSQKEKTAALGLCMLAFSKPKSNSNDDNTQPLNLSMGRK